MRALVLSALTLAAVVSLTADASACGKRKKASAAVVTYAAPACDPCAGGATGYPGGYHHGYYGGPAGYHTGHYNGSPYYGAPYSYPGAYGGPALMPGAIQPGTVVVPGTLPPK